MSDLKCFCVTSSGRRCLTLWLSFNIDCNFCRPFIDDELINLMHTPRSVRPTFTVLLHRENNKALIENAFSCVDDYKLTTGMVRPSRELLLVCYICLWPKDPDIRVFSCANIFLIEIPILLKRFGQDLILSFLFVLRSVSKLISKCTMLMILVLSWYLIAVFGRFYFFPLRIHKHYI